MFLPPNTTAVIQSMDQNIIQNNKLNYRTNLLSNIVTDKEKGVNLVAGLKKIYLNIVFNSADCWFSVSAHMIIISSQYH